MPNVFLKAFLATCMLLLGTACANTIHKIKTTTPTIKLTLTEFQLQRNAATLSYKLRQQDTLATTDILEPSPHIKNLRRVTPFVNTNIIPGGVSLSARYKMIAFHTLETKGDKIQTILWTAPIDGYSSQRLTFDDAIYLSPVFHQQDLYFSQRMKNNSFQIKKLDLKSPAKKISIVVTDGDQIDPFITHDQLLFTTVENNQTVLNIHALSANKSPAESTITHAANGRLNRDGNKLLYLKMPALKDDGFATSSSEIWVSDIAGKHGRKITGQSGIKIINANWSPDGRWIVYASNEQHKTKAPRNMNIWMVNIQTHTKKQLTWNASYDDQPVFTDDGQFIYFRSNRGGAWNIWKMQLESR